MKADFERRDTANGFDKERIDRFVRGRTATTFYRIKDTFIVADTEWNGGDLMLFNRRCFPTLAEGRAEFDRRKEEP